MIRCFIQTTHFEGCWVGKYFDMEENQLRISF